MTDQNAQGTGGTRLRDWYARLSRAQRLNIAKALVVVVGAALLWAAYGARQDADTPQGAATKDVTTVALGDARLEDDIRAQFERDRQEMVSQSSQQAKVQNQQASDLAAQQRQLELMQQALEAMGASPSTRTGRPPPDDPEEWANAPTLSGERLDRSATIPAQVAPPQLIYVGDIGVAADPVLAAQRTAAPAADEDAKPDIRTIRKGVVN